MSITKNNGFKFLDFLVVKESEIYDYHRLAGSYTVIKSNNKYLLCYNTMRKQWELPAGQREENETTEECAIRELYDYFFLKRTLSSRLYLGHYNRRIDWNLNKSIPVFLSHSF